MRQAPERQPRFVNDAGDTVEPAYTPADLAVDGFSYDSHLGFPGEYPYTRGIDPAMYRRELPIVSAYAGFGDPRDSNRRYRELIQLGGALGAMESGYIQNTITAGASRRQQAFERKERVAVGLNLFPVKTELRPQTFRIDADVERRQVARLQQVKQERNRHQVAATLAEVAASARDGRNVVPTLVDAVKAYASVGEICGVLKSVYGEYEPDRSF